MATKRTATPSNWGQVEFDDSGNIIAVWLDPNTCERIQEALKRDHRKGLSLDFFPIPLNRIVGCGNDGKPTDPCGNKAIAVRPRIRSKRAVRQPVSP